MRRCLFAALIVLSTWSVAGAAAPPPYLKLAQALGTPALADSYGTPDKSQLLLKFVANGESLKRWTKMTTVSILKVPSQDTDGAIRDVVSRMKALLAKRKVKVVRFDRSLASPPTAYFEFETSGERDHGVIYSPHSGFITVAQISAKSGGSFSSDDVRKLKSIIGGR